MKNLSIGTYSIKENIEEILRISYEKGIRLFDSAPNYQDGEAHRYLNELGKSAGDGEVFVTTKIGYVPNRKIEGLIQSGVVCPEKLFNNNCMSNKYIKYQLDKNKQELNSCRIECILLHNIEIQAMSLSHDDFVYTLSEAFYILEDAVSQGIIEKYGVSTWHGFRNILDIRELVKIAENVSGINHNFKIIQLPISLVNIDSLYNLYINNSGVLVYAKELGLEVQASSPLHKGELIKILNPELINHINDGGSAAMACYLFSSSSSYVDRLVTSPSKVSHIFDLLELERNSVFPAYKMKNIIEMLTKDV